MLISPRKEDDKPVRTFQEYTFHRGLLKLHQSSKEQVSGVDYFLEQGISVNQTVYPYANTMHTSFRMVKVNKSR